MTRLDTESGFDKDKSNSIRWLYLIAIFSSVIYGVILFISPQFNYESELTDRPILLVLILFAVAFIGYCYAIRFAMQARQDRNLLWMILAGAIVFRLILLFSVPIQEIDIYRYLWDGAVTAQGVSPYSYTPDDVRLSEFHAGTGIELSRLIRLRDADPALADILNRIHFGELPTVYPPTSQLVFAFANLTTPKNATVFGYLITMKSWLIGFDLATLVLVIQFLKLCDKTIGLSIVYAWCPLLMKEVANSGHLDAIAVFLTSLSAYLLARSMKATKTNHRLCGFSVLCLSLAVGAKLYPMVLAPVWFLTFAKKLGWNWAIVYLVSFCSVIALLLWPMLPTDNLYTESNDASDLALPNESQTFADPSLGLQTFLRQWEMNDFIFLLLVENLTPAEFTEQVAWFSVIPESIRQAINGATVNWIGIADKEASFFVARVVTMLIFFLLALHFAWRATKRESNAALFEAAFLTLAWFWLLCPTQNPWYWTWTLPFLPFARSRAWVAVSGLVPVYYLRFWLEYHFPNSRVLGTAYDGINFFDFIVTWIEYAPWFTWLFLGAVWHRPRIGSET